MHLGDIDAIACAVDADGKSVVTKTILAVAGNAYAESLKEVK